MAEGESSVPSKHGRLGRQGSILGPPPRQRNHHDGRPYLDTLDALVKHPGFEVLFMVLILANSAVMAVEAEYLGYETGQKGELPGNFGVGAQGWDNAGTVFEVVEFMFGCAFAFEALLKLVVYGRDFFKSPWNDFDLFVVLFWILEKVLPVVPVPTLVLRLARLVKALRLVRLTRTLEFADTLNLIIVAVKVSLSAFVWSLLLLSLITMVVALVLNYGLKAYVEDLLIAEDPRVDIYLLFGTFWRSLLSVIELTLGNWVPITRELQENISPWLAFGVVVYRLIMEIAILKVLTGVFLHETFRVAKSDQELMIRGKMREDKLFKDEMANLFNEMHTDGVGKLSKHDFQVTFNNPRASMYLGALGLNYKDAEELWSVVMEESGQTSSAGEVSTADVTRAIGNIRGEGRNLNVVMALQRISRLTTALQDSRLISVPPASPPARASNDPLDDCFVKDDRGPSEARASDI